MKRATWFFGALAAGLLSFGALATNAQPFDPPGPPPAIDPQPAEVVAPVTIEVNGDVVCVPLLTSSGESIGDVCFLVDDGVIEDATGVILESWSELLVWYEINEELYSVVEVEGATDVEAATATVQPRVAVLLNVGDENDLPINPAGNPKVGHFDHRVNHFDLDDLFVYDLEGLDLCVLDLAVVTMVVVRSDDGAPIIAWSAGTPIQKTVGQGRGQSQGRGQGHSEWPSYTVLQIECPTE